MSLQHTWTCLTRRLAALVGASTALLSLFHGAPVGVASMRGAAALLGFGFLAKLGLRALERSTAGELEARPERATSPAAVKE